MSSGALPPDMLSKQNNHKKVADLIYLSKNEEDSDEENEQTFEHVSL
jgi:hypothetical protein